MARNYHQGVYTPKNPQKYIGNPNNIIYRSSWEKKVMLRFDTTPSILKWSSEEFVIPYVSPVDGRPHRYFVDFVVEYKTRDGKIKRAAVEVKPDAQTKLPATPKRMTKQFMESVETYAVNQAKWEAAKKWCANNGMEFIILTEYDLGIKK
jgi:hypothetical protein